MGPTQGTFSLHSAFVGGELLPAAPLQPCAGAPSGRGHLFSGWVNLAPCNFFQQQCPPCSTGMGHPLDMAPCAEALHLVGFIRSVGYIRALPVYSLPTIAHYIVSCLFCAPYSIKLRLMLASNLSLDESKLVSLRYFTAHAHICQFLFKHSMP